LGVLILAAILYLWRPAVWSAVVLAVFSFVFLSLVVLQTGPIARAIFDLSPDRSDSFRDGLVSMLSRMNEMHAVIFCHGFILSLILVAHEWRSKRKTR
jgi:hypothetical protein